MANNKVLFIDTAHSELEKQLNNQGFICDFYPEYTREDYIKIADNYVGIIIRSKIKLDRDFLQYCSNLKFVGRVGAGMENIDIAAAKEFNVACLNAPEGNRNAVAEQAVGMILNLFNRLLIADNEVRNGVWIREGNRGVELGGKTVGIIGYGNTGGAFAKKLSGFDVNVIAYDKYKTGFSDEYVTEVTMDEIFCKSDILSLHIPLTEETKFLVNRKYLERFEKNIYVVNTSRGKILVTRDLVDMLDSGKVIGACLDVLEYEGLSFENVVLPEEFRMLTKLKNVVLSPHIAGWTHESNIKMALTIADKVKKLQLL